MKTLVAVIAAVASAAAAYAQQSNRAPADSEDTDPNRVIWQRVTDTGSRLSRSRICMTRAEWEVHRREMKQQFEIIQSNRPLEGQ